MTLRPQFAPALFAWTAACLLAVAASDAWANPFVTTTAATAGTTGGTLGAEAEEEDYAKARRFIESQWAQIRRDAAVGGGEHLNALATLLHQPDNEAFARRVQMHYGALFTDTESDADALLDRLNQLAVSDSGSGSAHGRRYNQRESDLETAPGADSAQQEFQS